MKAIMVMFDTLRRTMMPCFQPEDQKVPMPNFQRLISHSAVFDHHYVYSGKAGAAYGQSKFPAQELGAAGTI